jgi:hypothetical protein
MDNLALALDNSVLSNPQALSQSRFNLSINTCTGCPKADDWNSQLEDFMIQEVH